MGKFFFWMNIPDLTIPETVWNEFLNGMAAQLFTLVAIAAVLTVLLYAWSARRKKIYSIDDVFSAYTPLLWLLLAPAAGAVMALLCLLQYVKTLGIEGGELGVAFQMGIAAMLMAGGLAYLAIVFIPGVTPAKFLYRSVPFRHRNKAARQA